MPVYVGERPYISYYISIKILNYVIFFLKKHYHKIISVINTASMYKYINKAYLGSIIDVYKPYG